MLLLLALPLVLLWLLLAYYRHRIGFGNLSIRGSLVLAYLTFQFVLLGITEVASVGGHLTHWTVACAWFIATVALLLAARAPLTTLWGQLRSREWIRSEIKSRFGSLGGEEWFWIGIVALIVGALAFQGSIYPPSNRDSMAYHLARVEHWIQNRSIAPFATHNLAQIDLSPLSEYNLTHLQLLSGSNRFDWTMQWVAALISIVAVSELTRLLGGKSMTQIAASVVCATIPTGILLAASTENDYFAAAIGIGFLVLLAAFSFGHDWAFRAAALGASAGLAYMAKGTVPLMFAPVAVAFILLAAYRRALWGGDKASVRQAIGPCLVGVAGAAVVVGPFSLQNVQLLGSVTGITSKSTISSPITFTGFGANVVRSTAANFDIGDGIHGIDTYVSKALLPLFHQMYSIFGVSQNDQIYALGPHVNTFALQSYSYAVRTGDIGANPWNVLLIATALIILAVAVLRSSREVRVTLMMGLALACGYLLFTGSARWSEFNVRYTLPLLVAYSAVIAIALARFHRWVTRLVLIALTVACLPQLLNNAHQPLAPPRNFAKQPYLTPYFWSSGGASETSDYETVTSVLAESTCHKAALTTAVDDEYVLWVGLGHEHWTGTLNDFDVNNPSAKLEPRYQPCASISQQARYYITPSNGTVNVQEGDLAISLPPADAASIHTSIPGVSSTVLGARVLPGGGWSLAGFGHVLALGAHSSLYLFSDESQQVVLQLHRLPGSPTVVITTADDKRLPTVVNHDIVLTDLSLRKGVTRVDLTAEASSATTRRLAAFMGVTLVPSTR